MLPSPAALLLPLLLSALAAGGWLGVYLDTEVDEARIIEVVPDSPAARAGLAVGDVVLAVGSRATPHRDDFIAVIRDSDAGARVRLRVRRGDRELQVTATLGERPDSGGVGAPAPGAVRDQGGRPVRPAPAAEPPPPAVQVPAPSAYLGVSVRETSAGVVVDRVLPDGPLATARIAPGEVFEKLGEQRLVSLADLDAALRTKAPGQRVAIDVRGPDGVRTISVSLGARPTSGLSPGREALVRVVPPPAPLAPRAVEPAPPAPDRAAVLERELADLRAEVAELRRRLDALQRQSRRN